MDYGLESPGSILSGGKRVSLLYSIQTGTGGHSASCQMCQVCLLDSLVNSLLWAESEPYVTTVGQSASLSWNKDRGALFDEGTGLSFVYAAGPRQRTVS
jgi:hypothetical protein